MTNSNKRLLFCSLSNKIRRHLVWVLPAIFGLIVGLMLLLLVFILPQLEVGTIKQQITKINQAIQSKTLTNEHLEQSVSQISKHNIFNRELPEYLVDYIRQEFSKAQPFINASDSSFTTHFLTPVKAEVNQPEKYLEKRFSSLTNLEKSIKNSQKSFVSPAQFIRKRTVDHKIIDQFQSIAQLDLTPYLKNSNAIAEQLAKIRQALTILQNHPQEWRIEPTKVIILKRARYQDLKQIFGSTELNSLVLIKDKTPPEIIAITQRVPRGSHPDTKLFSCIDDVDDQVDCKISQKPDYSKPGTYSVKVSASDQAKNNAERSFNITVYRQNLPPYYIKVSKTHQVVMVYGLDAQDNYTKLIKTFVTSTGLSGNTPVGIFNTRKYHNVWADLVGNVWGQYPIQIIGFFWFHSVPYFTPNNSQLEWQEYNKLGRPASAGCVRLSVADAKWLYDNTPNGTKVEIYNGPLPPGVTKPSAQKLSANDPRRGWDPTDPAVGNPWR
mgnify:CR=1 FL=1